MNRSSFVLFIIFSVFFQIPVFSQVDYDVCGRYTYICRSKNKVTIPECGTIIDINKDSTFNIKRIRFLGSYISYGKWHIEKKRKLVLNSVLDVQNLPINVNESYNPNHSTKLISIDNLEHLDDDIKYDVVLNDTLHFKNVDVFHVNEEVSIKTIKIKFYISLPENYQYSLLPIVDTLLSENYHVKYRESNEISVRCIPIVNIDLFYYIPINNLSFISEGNSIILKEKFGKRKKFRKIMDMNY